MLAFNMKICTEIINWNELSSQSVSASSSSTASSFSSNLGSIFSSIKLSAFLNTSLFHRACSRYDSDVSGLSPAVYSAVSSQTLV